MKLGAKGKFLKLQNTVTLRFAPEPSGCLHVGHVKALVINDYYRRLHNGKLILRFDNTNPIQETKEFEKQILRDCKNLGIKFDRVVHTSDHFEKIFGYLELLISNGDAYVDFSTSEEICEQRRKAPATKTSPAKEPHPSPYRQSSVETNLAEYKRMRTGETKSAIIRAKISYNHKNAALRDPTLGRMQDGQLLPTYDLACPIVDHLDKVTHAFRDRQYHDRNDLYKWVLKKLRLPLIELHDFSRLCFKYSLLSKRKIAKLIDNGSVDDWNHPSLSTVQSLLRRGVHPEALKLYIESMGTTINNSLMDQKKMWTLNRKFIDPSCPRYFAIQNPVPMKISDLEQSTTKEVRLHPKNVDLGTRSQTIDKYCLIEKEDADLIKADKVCEFTLINFGNVVCNEVCENTVKVTSNFDGNFKSTKYKVHWLNQCKLDVRKVVIEKYKDLLNVESLPKTDGSSLDQYVNNPLKEIYDIVMEADIPLRKGFILQFQRIGYYICDYVDDELVRFIEIRT